MVETAYVAVALIGALHGLEPSHGWPIAMLYASPRSHPLTRAFVSSWIIAAAHLVSSLAVVAAYVILQSVLQFSIPYIDIIAGLALVVLAVRFFIEKPRTSLEENHGHMHDNFDGGYHVHEHDHPDVGVHNHRHKHSKKMFLSQTGIAVFALVLGFVHEEEFALLALAVGGVDPLRLMLTYAGAVMGALIAVTLLAVKVYSQMEEKLRKYEGVIPKISGLILLVTAGTFFLNLR
jgi:hypothetical protein